MDCLDQELEDLGNVKTSSVINKSPLQLHRQDGAVHRSVEADSLNMALGTSSSTLTEEQLVMNNPHLKKLLNKMLDERIQDAKRKCETSSSELLMQMAGRTEQQGQQEQTEQVTHKRKQNTGIVKSPSDMTIYIPAYSRMLAHNNGQNSNMLLR